MTERWRRALAVLVAVGALGAGPSVATAVDTTVLDVLRNPPRFAGQFVTVRGTMGAPRPLMGGRPALTVFDLADGGGVLKVLAASRPACFPGSAVTVEGRFESMRNVEGQTFVNVVDAAAVICR